METETNGVHLEVHAKPVHTGEAYLSPVGDTTSYEVEKSVGLGVGEIMSRVICLVFLVSVLIAAIVTLSAVNTLEDYTNERDEEYENADSYRGAAGWLMFLAIVAIIYHSIMILLRILYMNLTIKNYFSGYAFINALICLIFGVSLFAGGITSAVYAADNNDLYNDHCTASSEVVADITFCEDLETLYGSQAAAATFSFLSMAIFILLFVITLISGIRKVRKVTDQGSSSGLSNRSNNDSSSTATPYVPLNNW